MICVVTCFCVGFLSFSTSSADSRQSESETPVRPLRATRSRTAQSSTSARVTRNSRAASKKAEQVENTVPESKGNRDKVVKVTLPKASKTRGHAVTSPGSASSGLSSTASGNENETNAVLQRARAYESMLSQRNQGWSMAPSYATLRGRHRSSALWMDKTGSVSGRAVQELILCKSCC